MIDQFIKTSRASFKKEANVSMYRYFDDLMNIACNVHSDIIKPTLKICFSLNRTCETLKYQNTQYIIYDEYLGQSFNKMNRILFYEDNNEAIAYLCKILSEEFYLTNKLEKAIPYNVYYQLHSKAKVFDLPTEFIEKKSEIVSIQESFVFFHEFAHLVVSNDPKQVVFAENFIASNDTSNHIIDAIKIHLKEKNRKPSEIHSFYEETACDFLATNFTYTFFKNIHPVKHANILSSISAGFLFLRTLYDLKNKANNRYDQDGNTYTLFMKLRYNVLRSYFSIFTESDSTDDLIDIYEKWEEKFDMNLVLNLTDEFEKKLLNIFKNRKFGVEENIVSDLFGV